MERLTVRENLTLAASAAEGMALRWTRQVRDGDRAALRVRPVADRLGLSALGGQLRRHLVPGRA